MLNRSREEGSDDITSFVADRMKKDFKRIRFGIGRSETT
jgi:peptidyl-tRNA hydrolase